MSQIQTTVASGTDVHSLVCSLVPEVAVASQLNATASTSEQVTITDIDRIFDLSFNPIDLRHCFDCSGWGINKTNLQAQQLIRNLAVDLSGSGLHTALAAAIGESGQSASTLGVDTNANGQRDASGHNLNLYLRNEFINAFAEAFPQYQREVSGNDVNVENGVLGTSGVEFGTGGSVDAGSAGGPSVAVQTSTVYSYNFEIDVSGGAAADAMIAGLSDDGNSNAGNSYLNSLFMQLDYFKRIAAHTDENGNPNDRALPLEEGDSITFVFDIKVSASTNPNTSNASPSGNLTGQDITGEPAGNTANGDTSQVSGRSGGPGLSMDLGTRRVAFVLKQSLAGAADNADYADTDAALHPANAVA